MLAKCGSGAASIRLADALCAPGPYASLRGIEFVEPNKSPKREESAQPATPNPINEMATSCGQRAVRGDTRMVTHSVRNTKDERINNLAVNRVLNYGGLIQFS